MKNQGARLFIVVICEMKMNYDDLYYTQICIENMVSLDILDTRVCSY